MQMPFGDKRVFGHSSEVHDPATHTSVDTSLRACTLHAFCLQSKSAINPLIITGISPH